MLPDPSLPADALPDLPDPSLPALPDLPHLPHLPDPSLTLTPIQTGRGRKRNADEVSHSVVGADLRKRRKRRARNTLLTFDIRNISHWIRAGL